MGNINLQNSIQERKEGWGEDSEDEGSRQERETGTETTITLLRENKENVRLDTCGKVAAVKNAPEIHSTFERKEITEFIDLMVVEVTEEELEGKRGVVGEDQDKESKVIGQKSSLRTPLADCTNSMHQLKKVGGSFRREKG